MRGMAESAPSVFALLRTYVRALGLLRDERRTVLLLVAANVALGLLQLAEPILFGRVVDAELLTETFHSGLLFEAPLGTPVEAVAAGRVRFAGWFRGYGQLVILDHGDGYFSVSGHLDSLEVAVGDAVQARHAIGRVGETGTLAGPRLYFEIRRGGEPLDPADWLRMPGAR